MAFWAESVFKVGRYGVKLAETKYYFIKKLISVYLLEKKAEYSLLSISGTSTGPKKMVRLIRKARQVEPE